MEPDKVSVLFNLQILPVIPLNLMVLHKTRFYHMEGKHLAPATGQSIIHLLVSTKYIYLNLTNAASTGSEFWNNTEPTSSVVTTKGEPNSMGSAGDTIMYLWHQCPWPTEIWTI